MVSNALSKLRHVIASPKICTPPPPQPPTPPGNISCALELKWMPLISKWIAVHTACHTGYDPGIPIYPVVTTDPYLNQLLILPTSNCGDQGVTWFSGELNDVTYTVTARHTWPNGTWCEKTGTFTP